MRKFWAILILVTQLSTATFASDISYENYAVLRDIFLDQQASQLDPFWVDSAEAKFRSYVPKYDELKIWESSSEAILNRYHGQIDPANGKGDLKICLAHLYYFLRFAANGFQLAALKEWHGAIDSEFSIVGRGPQQKARQDFMESLNVDLFMAAYEHLGTLSVAQEERIRAVAQRILKSGEGDFKILLNEYTWSHGKERPAPAFLSVFTMLSAASLSLLPIIKFVEGFGKGPMSDVFASATILTSAILGFPAGYKIGTKIESFKLRPLWPALQKGCARLLREDGNEERPRLPR